MASKNVVIVGGGFAGVSLAKELEKRKSGLPSDHAIVLVDARDYFWHTPAGLRAPLDGKTNDDHLIPNDRLFKAGSHDRVVRAKATKIDADAVYTEAQGADARIEYAVLVIATGSKWSAQLSPPAARAQALDFFKQQGDALAAAKSVLVIGGGAVGVEIAGELAEVYKVPGEKKVTLVHRGARLMGDKYPEKLHRTLLGQLQGQGVDVKLSTSVTDQTATSATLSTGEQIDADFIYNAIGTTPNADLVKAFDPSAIAANGCIKVDAAFQVAGHEGRIFALGDVADLQEGKQCAKTPGHVGVAAPNIAAAAMGAADTRGRKQYKQPSELILVSVGRKAGAGVMFGWTVGGFMTSMIKSKGLFIGQSRSMMNY